MTDKELKTIYEYMRWKPYKKTSLPDCLGRIKTKICFQKPLNSNSAWEVIQEMERKGDWGAFSKLCLESQQELYPQSLGELVINFYQWLSNPSIFFRCFAKWLLEKEETQ